jgi:hypothetical protein
MKNETKRGEALRYNENKTPWSLNLYSHLATILYGQGAVSTFCNALAEIQEQQTLSAVDNLIKQVVLYASRKHDMSPIELLELTTLVWKYGADKYAEWNWVSGQKWSFPMASFFRHLLKLEIEDETTDEESGIHHVAHMMCNAMMLKHYVEYMPELNDMPPREMFATPFPAE